jgi:hypothetical protein
MSSTNAVIDGDGSFNSLLLMLIIGSAGVLDIESDGDEGRKPVNSYELFVHTVSGGNIFATCEYCTVNDIK